MTQFCEKWIKDEYTKKSAQLHVAEALASIFVTRRYHHTWPEVRRIALVNNSSPLFIAFYNY